MSAPCGYKIDGSGGWRNPLEIKAFKHHRSVLPIPRNWQTYRTQNAVPARGCGFKPHLRHSTAGKRTDGQGSVENPSLTVIFAPGSMQFPQKHSAPPSRTDAHQPVHKRPPTATVLLPEMLPADPDLTAVIDAWDRLLEAVRAGIVAMVKAAGKDVGG